MKWENMCISCRNRPKSCCLYIACSYQEMVLFCWKHLAAVLCVIDRMVRRSSRPYLSEQGKSPPLRAVLQDVRSDSQFLFDLRDLLDCKIQVFFTMSRRYLGANSCRTFRNDRIRKAYDVNTFFEELFCHLLGEDRISEHDRYNRMFPGR